MQALVQACAQPDFPAEVCLVLSNKADAAGVTWAGEQGIQTEVLSHRGFDNREDFDRAMHVVIQKYEPDIICLAGFMRLLTPWFVRQWRGKMLNIHPSLLPKFKGLDTHARAIVAGEKTHGCTVHFVDEEMDTGPVILQAEVPVLPDDDETQLAARVLEQEHRLYPEALRKVVMGDVSVLSTTTKPAEK